MGGVPALLYYVSPTQVNLEIPYGLPGGPTQLKFTSLGATGSYPLLITGTSPAIFLVGKYAAAIDSDGTINGSGSGFGSATAGSYVSIYIAGGGTANADGTLQAPTQVYIGGAAAQVPYAGTNPYLVGVDQINVSVPGRPDERGLSDHNLYWGQQVKFAALASCGAVAP